MSHRKLLFFFVSLSIASPIDQYFQHYPAPSLGGTGIDPGTLDLQSSWNNPSLVAAAVPDTLNPVPSFDQSSLLSQTWGDPLFDSPPPQGYHGRGPPVPIDPNLGFSDFGRYPGYPSANTPDLLDPETGNTQYYAQPRRGCKDPNKKLYCCRPILIMCREFIERWPQCIPSQQQCCDSTDYYLNGLGCVDSVDPREVPQPLEESDNGNDPSGRSSTIDAKDF